MSVPPISSSSTTQPPIPTQVGSASESMLSAAQAITSTLVSTSAVSSASQYTAETLLTTETLLTMSERPSTPLSQPVDSRSFEVIIPCEDPTVTTRSYPRLCDPAAVTLPLHSTPLEQFGTHEIPVSFGTQFVSPLSG